MRISPVSIILFSIVFAVIALPLLASFFTNIANSLAVVSIPTAKSDVDLGKSTLKTLSDWIFSILTNPLGLIILVAITLAIYAAEEAVRK